MAEAWDLSDFLMVKRVSLRPTGHFLGIRSNKNKLSFNLKFGATRSDKDERVECTFTKEYTFNEELQKALGKRNFKTLPEAVKAVFIKAMNQTFPGKVRELEDTFEKTDVAIRKRIEAEFDKSTNVPKTIDPKILTALNKFRQSAFDDYIRAFRNEMNTRMEELLYWCIRQVLPKLAPKKRKLRNVTDKELVLRSIGVGLIVTVVVLSIVLLTVAAPPVGAAVAGATGAGIIASGITAGVGHAFTALNSVSALQSIGKTVQAFRNKYISYWKAADRDLSAAQDSIGKAAAAIQMLVAERASLEKELKAALKTLEKDDKAIRKAEVELYKAAKPKQKKAVKDKIKTYMEMRDITETRIKKLVTLLDDDEVDKFVTKLMAMKDQIEQYTNKDAKRLSVKVAGGLDSLLDDVLGKFFDGAAALGRAAQIVLNKNTPG